MGLEVWRAEAPSNIALIKYMGKTNLHENRPSNASLSFTLDHLITTVEIWPSESGRDQWEPLKIEDFYIPALSDASAARFLKHFDFLKSTLEIPGHYVVKSANNFPSDCGLASSASSFAALTLASWKLSLSRSLNRDAAEALTPQNLSQLSRQGSGSSCRSLFTPWALWKEEGAMELKFPWMHLHHQVALLEKGKKAVSSSEAHSRVSSGELFQGRAARAERRLKQLTEALLAQDWKKSCELVWSDYWDMHALFETADPPFGYMTPKTMAVLELSREIWRNENDGPMVTLDAGANVHLLYRLDQTRLAERVAHELHALGGVIESPSLRREGRR